MSLMNRTGQALVELGVCFAGFALAAAPFHLLAPDLLPLVAAMACVCWIGFQMQGSYLEAVRAGRSGWVVAIERTWLGTGLNLLLLAVLTYTSHGEPGAFQAAIVGCIFAGTATGWIAGRAKVA